MRASSCMMSLCVALSACTSSPPDDGGDARPRAMEASAATLAAVGIARWEVREERGAAEPTARFKGLDPAGTPRAELRISPAGEARQVEGIFPEKARVLVSADGTIAGTVSDGFRRLVTALYADTGAARLLPPSPAPEGDGDTVAFEPSIAAEGHEPVWGGWFGARANYDVGPGWCPNGGHRTSAEAYSNNGASCWVNRWSSGHSADCRINLHWGAQPFWSDVCNWYIYQEP
jgi:hypothetical protein